MKNNNKNKKTPLHIKITKEMLKRHTHIGIVSGEGIVYHEKDVIYFLKMAGVKIDFKKWDAGEWKKYPF